MCTNYMKALFLCLLVTGSISIAIVKEEKNKRKYEPVSTEPITSEMCEEDGFKHLHMCVALKRDKPKLKKIIQENSCLFKLVERGLSPGSFTTEHHVHIRHAEGAGFVNTSSLVTLTSGSSKNNKTSAGSSTSISSSISMKSSFSHHIKKRSTGSNARNPCSGIPIQVIINEAEDKDSGVSYELVHDPDSHLYQTFFIEKCNSFVTNGMTCARHDIIFKTLVYLYPPGVSDEVGTKFIRTKGTCALSYP